MNRVFPVIGAADTFEEIDVSEYERTVRGSRDVEEVDMDTKEIIVRAELADHQMPLTG
jgi:NCS1 family nucleobase:cation symporter-1